MKHLGIKKILRALAIFLMLPLSAAAQDLETYTHKLTQSVTGYEFWTTPPSERVFKNDAVPSESGSEVKVYAAKNEFEPFQVVVKPTSNGNVKVNIGDFASGITTEIFQVKYVNISQVTDNLGKTGDYPDPLWPIEKDASISLTSGENTAFWFNIHVPKTADSSDYTANVTIAGITIPVKLHVFNFAVPDELHVKSQMNFSHQTILDKYGVSGTGDDYWTYVDKIKQYFIDHRLTPKAPLWSGGLTYNGGKPYIDYDCDTQTFTDNDGIWGFETPAERYLGGDGLMDGKFSSSFNQGTGFPSFMAATFQNNDSSDDQRPDSFCGQTRGAGDWYTANNPSSAYNQKWFAYVGAMENYLNNLGYLNEAYYYFANEPQNQDDYDAVAWYSKELKNAAPNLKLMISEEPKAEIYDTGKIDIWLPVLNDYDPEISHDREKNHGEETWIYFLHGTRPPYFNPITLDHPGIESKFTGWFLWKYRVRGIAYYSMNNWDQNPWTNPINDGHNGDLSMLYPPSESNSSIAYGINNHRFVPSIRFELMRDSLEDYEYLYVLNGNKKPEVEQSRDADTQAGKIISGLTSYTRNSEFLYNLRRLIGLKNGNEITSIPDIQVPSEGTPGNHHINFQDPAGDPTADPLVADGKEYMKIGVNAYDETLGYGWFGATENFKTNYDPWGDETNELKRSYAYDDYAHNPNTFQFDLPNGTYNVEICVGSPRQNTAHNKVIVEGITFIDDEAANTYIIRSGEVTVSDGNMTLEVGIFDKYTFLCYLNIEAANPPETTTTTNTTTTTSTTTSTTTTTSTSPVTTTTIPVITVAPSQAGELNSIINDAEPGSTILFADGTYNLNGEFLRIVSSDLTIRSESGDRGKVILDGAYESEELISIAASDVTISDITLKRAKYHPIHISPTDDGDVENTLIKNVHIIDPGQQAVKINPNAARTRFADNGIIEKSRIELTDEGRSKVWEINGSCYTGGIDGHQASGWQVRDNEIEGFWCDQGLSEHGIHFWNGSRDTLVERNKLVDNTRGVGLGLGESGDGWRTYDDNPCEAVSSAGHYGGIIRNNVLFQQRQELYASEYKFDSGIGLEQACGTKVLHNTIISTETPVSSSIEWRFSDTSADIINNLVSHNLKQRDNGVADLQGNLENAPLSLFGDAENGDFHLSASASVIDQGAAVDSSLVENDIVGIIRDSNPDIGAFEWCNPPPGDLSGNCAFDMKDAILALQIIVGIKPLINLEANDVDGNGKTGLAEVIYVFQKITGLR